MNKFVIVILLFTLSACKSGAPIKEAISNEQPTVADVVKLIKEDIKKYQNYSASVQNEPLANSCNGYVNFNIESIKVSMKVQTINGAEGKAGLTIPMGVVEVGPSGSVAQKETNTQTLTFTMYPEKGVKSSEEIDKTKPKAENSPIASTLVNLRENLLIVSNVKPCMTFQNPIKDKDVGATFEFGFGVEKKAIGGVGLEFIIFSVGASKSSLKDYSNTITVTFKGVADTKHGPTIFNR